MIKVWIIFPRILQDKNLLSRKIGAKKYWSIEYMEGENITVKYTKIVCNKYSILSIFNFINFQLSEFDLG